MKRDTTGKFVPNWDSEAKQQVCITLTATARRFLEEEAQKQGLSRSELIERFARSLGEQNAPALSQENQPASSQTDKEAVGYRAANPPAAEQKVETILESISDAFVAFDRDWRYTYVNRAAANMLQQPAEALLGRHVWRDVFPGLVGELPYQQLHQAMSEQVPVSWEEWGEPIKRWLEVNAYPSPEGVTVYFRDITERKRAEQEIQALNQALEQRVAELQTLLDVIPIGIAIAEDRECKVIRVNTFFQRLFGVAASDNLSASNEDAISISFKHFQNGRELSAEELPVQVAAATACEIRNCEIQLVRSDGMTLDLIGHATPLLNEQGAVRGSIGVFMDITERKQTEAVLQESEARYRRLFEHNPQPMWIFDAETLAFLAVNEAAIQHYGYSKDEFLAMTIRDIRPPEDIPELLNILASKPAIGLDDAGTWKHRKKDGTLIDVRITSHAETFLDKQAWLVLVKDVTAQKRAETALRQSEEKYRSIVQTANEGIWLVNTNAQTLYCNDRMAEMLGYTVTELLERTVLECCFTEDIPLAQEQIRRNLSGDKEQFDFRFQRKDGSELLVLACTSAITDEQGNVTGALGMFTDVTDRKRAVQELQAVHSSFNVALSAAQMGTWDLDLVNDTARRSLRHDQIFGYDTLQPEWGQEIAKRHVLPEDQATFDACFQQALVTGELKLEVRIIWTDQSLHWINALGRVYYNEQQPVRMAGVVMDITDRKQAETALRQSEERLRLALMVGKAGIWDWDIRRDQITWSERIYEFHGLVPGSFGGRIEDFARLVHPDDQTRVSEAIRQTLEENVPFELEFRAIQPSGAIRWLSTSGGVILDAQGCPVRMLGAMRDITERKAVEEERERLLRSEQRARAEAESANRIKDEFLAVLSHELRSPLNPILGWSKLLQKEKLDGQTRRQALEAIERNAKLQTQLIDDLLDVSRILRGKMGLNICPTNPETVVKAALENMQLAAEAKQIQIKTSVTWGSGRVLGDPTRLQQIVWNLLSNAIKFTPQGGRVDVCLNQVDTYAQIQVKDNGKGISPEFLPCVFDYFRQEDGKTTRQFGGLGLGLAIVRHLTELHGGTVHAESPGEGQGATFTLCLPLMAISAAPSTATPAKAQPASLSQLRILVVDDEEDMRTLTQAVLEQRGAQVTVAASAAEALILFDQQPPDLFISDIGMPDTDGYMLMRQIRRRSPEQGGLVPAIALTAYAGEQDQQLAIEAGFQRHIPKPVEPATLIRAIADLASQA